MAYCILVEQTLEPVGRPLASGETALILADPAATREDARRALQYWSLLVGA